MYQGPTRTCGLIKDLITTATVSNLETTMHVEGELQDIAINTADHREGVAAFLQALFMFPQTLLLRQGTADVPS